MKYLYLVSFFAAILLGVRLLFFGAERRRMKAGALPLRRSEPAAVAFLFAFGLAGYLVMHRTHFATVTVLIDAILIGVVWAGIVTRVAIATVRIAPVADPNDPRYSLQGCVAVVVAAIDAEQTGEISFDGTGATLSLPARNIGHGGISAGEEVCIERIENGIAFVERWSQVEERL